MKDFFGSDLSIGDMVAFEAPHYRHLTLGKIIAFTRKYARVEFINTWNFGGAGVREEHLANPKAMVKKPSWKSPGTLVRCISEFKSVMWPDQDFGKLGEIYRVSGYLADRDYFTLGGVVWDNGHPSLDGQPVLVNACNFEEAE